jgi:effector-binding domain-containing protein
MKVSLVIQKGTLSRIQLRIGEGDKEIVVVPDSRGLLEVFIGDASTYAQTWEELVELVAENS